MKAKKTLLCILTALLVVEIAVAGISSSIDYFSSQNFL